MMGDKKSVTAVGRAERSTRDDRSGRDCNNSDNEGGTRIIRRATLGRRWVSFLIALGGGNRSAKCSWEVL